MSNLSLFVGQELISVKSDRLSGLLALKYYLFISYLSLCVGQALIFVKSDRLSDCWL